MPQFITLMELTQILVSCSKPPMCLVGRKLLAKLKELSGPCFCYSARLLKLLLYCDLPAGQLVELREMALSPSADASRFDLRLLAKPLQLCGERRLVESSTQQVSGLT
ncbi:hypothetical protein B5D80_16525 [Micromonospora wenchangensis]|uniref:Uncharacterized protein n=1 Tax=Micromonospora wenchangensis TaxID=1185415 RepID=A0A246RKR3_9ACTN|nr:hypothetical protein B5D80_16525 [Micromonospora wenchangensis]